MENISMLKTFIYLRGSVFIIDCKYIWDNDILPKQLLKQSVS